MENSSRKEELIKYLFLLLQTIVCGVIIGLVVGVYQLAVSFFGSLSNNLYGNESILIVCVMVVIGMALAFINETILKIAPGVDGSGIPNIELGIRGKRTIDWKKEIIFMFVNSCVSTLAGFPLGSEGPSVVLSGKISKMTQEVSRIDNKDQTAIACGTGFGCAFLSPLAGIAYIFEESLHRFNPSLLLRATLMMLTAYFTTSLVNHHHLLTIVDATMPALNEYYVFFILVIVNTILGVLFTKCIVFVKRFFTLHKNRFLIKNRGYLLFALVIICNLVCLPLMGSGSKLISGISNYSLVYIVILILLFRFAITIITGSGRVTGGLVVPIMTLGAISGQLVFLLCQQWFGLSSTIQPIIILVSMCMVFGVVTKTPITSICLIFSTIGYCTNDYLHALIIIPIAGVTIYLAYYLSKLCKVDCMYELFMEITLEDDEKNRK